MMAERGANPNLVRKDGHTPFSVAVIAGDVDGVQELVAHGADLNRTYDPTEKIPDPVEPYHFTEAEPKHHAHRRTGEDRPRLLNTFMRRVCGLT
jgi:ankyrin repeat protein